MTGYICIFDLAQTFTPDTLPAIFASSESWTGDLCALDKCVNHYKTEPDFIHLFIIIIAICNFSVCFHGLCVFGSGVEVLLFKCAG